MLNNTETKPRVVVIGGGFGGVYTTRYLHHVAKRGDIALTLINRTNYFLFTPLLHEVATGGLTPLVVAEPIREIFRKSHIHSIQAEVGRIDVVKKEV